MDRNILDNRIPANSADAILIALQNLMEKKDYRDITVSDICREGNLSRKTFYKYYTSKEDVLDFLVESLCLGYTITDDHSIFLQYFEFWSHLKDWIAILIQNNLWYEINKKVLHHSADDVRERDWDALLNGHADRKTLVFEFTNFGLARMVEIWYESGFAMTPAELAHLTEHIISEQLRLC